MSSLTLQGGTELPPPQKITVFPLPGNASFKAASGITEPHRSAEGVVTAAKKYGMRGYGAEYMPDRRSPMAVVQSASDPVVQTTLSAVRSLRAQPRTESGNGKGYWLEHSLIVGEVEYYEPPIRGIGGPRIRLRPIATLSGEFDAATAPVISVAWNYAMREENEVRKPRDRDRILLVVQKSGSDQGWDAPEGRAAYMPGNHECMTQVTGFSDPEVQAVLRAVQNLRDGREVTPQPSGKRLEP